MARAQINLRGLLGKNQRVARPLRLAIDKYNIRELVGHVRAGFVRLNALSVTHMSVVGRPIWRQVDPGNVFHLQKACEQATSCAVHTRGGTGADRR